MLNVLAVPLALVLHAAQPAPAPAAQPVSHAALPAALGWGLSMLGQSSDSDGDTRDSGPGLRNMAIGAAIGAAGLGIAFTTAVLYVGILLGMGIGVLLVPSLFGALYLSVVVVATGAAAIPFSVAIMAVTLGLLWFGINTMLV